MRQYYNKEEDFVDEFFNWSATAALAVGRWFPNSACSNEMRRHQNQSIESGSMSDLVFASAVVRRPHGEDCYAEILLKSSERLVAVKVQSVGNETACEIISDRLCFKGVPL